MRHQFVEYIPEAIEPDTLYVSLEYNTAVHKCACGCGVEVVTPLSPREWGITYDGETVSLDPSIGNWSFPCKSHYIIRHGQVRWAARFNEEKIRAVRERDDEARAAQYGGLRRPLDAATSRKNRGRDSVNAKPGVWAKFLNWLGM